MRKRLLVWICWAYPDPQDGLRLFIFHSQNHCGGLFEEDSLTSRPAQIEHDSASSANTRPPMLIRKWRIDQRVAVEV